MEPRLKSLFRGQQSALLLKTLIFGLLLGLAWAGNFALPASLAFIVGAAFSYGSPASNSLKYSAAFIILIFLALFLGSRMLGGQAGILIFLIFSALFYILISLKSMFFVYRDEWHYFLTIALLYGLALTFFLINKSNFFFAQIIGFFLGIFLIVKELFRADANAKSDFFAWITALLAIELAWSISFLPIGFLSSANLAIISIFLIIDTLRKHQKGKLSRYAILANITGFVALVILIFAGSNWSIL